MAWVRVGQTGAESGAINELDSLNGTGHTSSTTKAFTGTRSYRISGSTARPIGYTGNFGNAVRISFMLNHNSGNNLVPLVGCVTGSAPVLFYYNTVDSTIGLIAGFQYNDSNIQIPFSSIAFSLGPTDTWLHIGATFYLSATNGFVSLYIDGLQVASWTGNTVIYSKNSTVANTSIDGVYAHGAITSWPQLSMSGSWTNYSYIDDLYVDKWDNSSGLVDAPVPLRRFLYAFPNGAGTYSQWTPSANSNWQNVDEIPPNNDTDYNKATIAGLKDTYQYSNITLPPDHAIRAVIPTAYARKTDAGVDSRIRFVSKTGSTEMTGDSMFLPVSYGFVSQRFEKQPDGISPWTETAFNSAEFGIESSGEF